MASIPPDCTEDAVYADRVRLWQRRDGYRFGLDPVLLAQFVAPTADARVLDVGTGAGPVALLLNYLYGCRRIAAVEVQPSLAQLARANFDRHQVPVDLFEGNFLEYAPDERFALILSNPPYRRCNQGVHARGERDLARHEQDMSLDAMVRHAASLLQRRGRLALVMLAERLMETLAAMRRVNLEPKRLRFVHASAQHSARIFLVEAQRGARPGLEVESPLMVYADSQRRVYTRECAELLWEQAQPPCES